MACLSVPHLESVVAMAESGYLLLDTATGTCCTIRNCKIQFSPFLEWISIPRESCSVCVPRKMTGVIKVSTCHNFNPRNLASFHLLLYLISMSLNIHDCPQLIFPAYLHVSFYYLNTLALDYYQRAS